MRSTRQKILRKQTESLQRRERRKCADKRQATWRLTFDTFHNDKRLPLKGYTSYSGALMRLLAIFVCVALGFAAMPAQSAGVRFFDILPDTKGRPLTGAVWYPCSAPERDRAPIARPAHIHHALGPIR